MPTTHHQRQDAHGARPAGAQSGTRPGEAASPVAATPARPRRAGRSPDDADRVATARIATPTRGRDRRLHGAVELQLRERHAADASTMPTDQPQRTQAGTARIAPTTVGAPSPTSAPPTSATSPAAMAGATIGTIARLTAGDDDRQPPERGEDDRQRRHLGGQRHAEALGEPARQPTAGPRCEPRGRSASPRRSARRSRASRAGTRRRRSGAGRRAGAGSRRPSERRRRPARPVPTRAPAGRRRPSPRPARPRRRSGERDVGDDRDRRDDRSPSPTESTGDRPDGRRDDGDVPAGDGHDVARRRPS